VQIAPQFFFVDLDFARSFARTSQERGIHAPRGAQGFPGQAVTVELPTPYGAGLYEMFQNGAIFYSVKTRIRLILRALYLG
jgi:hypothetical protein